MSGNIRLPKVKSGSSADKRTPVDDKKRASLTRRLSQRVALAEDGFADNGDIQGYCPFHEDAAASNKPSARFNPTYNYWVCFAPKADGCAEQGSDANLDKMLKKLSGSEKPASNVRHLGSAPSARKRAKVPAITEKQALQYCNDLQMAEGALEILDRKRLWDRETIAAMGIGIVDGSFMDKLANKPRISIPVYDAAGKYVGCRIYDAFGNASGRGDNKFFWAPAEVGMVIPKDTILRPSRKKKLSPKVVIMEGEPDAILATQDFRDSKAGISFVSGTHGSGRAWPHTANAALLKNREVYICLDNDEAGHKAVDKLVNAVKVGKHAQAVYVIHIPEYRDVTDWTDLRKNRITSADSARSTLLELMESAERKWSRSDDEASAVARASGPDLDALTPVRVDAAGTLSPGAPGALADVNILGRANSTFLLQTEVELVCARDKGSKCDTCPLGEMYDEPGYGRTSLTYYPHEASILEMADASDEQKRKKWKRDASAKCFDLEPEVREEVTAYPYLVEDNKQKDGDGSEPIQSMMFFIGTGDIDSASVQRVQYNKTAYWKDSSTVLYAWGTEDLGNDLDNFEMTEDAHRKLRKLMRCEGTVRDKLDEIAEDFAWNTTHIFGGPRRILHTLVDLTYHSVLRLPFEEQKAMKGWMDLMIMGDSHTGKSETTRKLSDFYGVGGTVNGGSTSRSGLLAGMAPSMTNSKFMFPKKGALPRNHRGLLTIEESHKLALKKNEGIIAQMADARDYGVFNLQMIGDIQASAATRLIWIANPPGLMSRNTLSEFPYGAADAIMEMMGGRENVTRFTMAIGVSEDDVTTDDARPKDEYRRAPRFTGKQRTLRQLLIWAWSRKPEHVKWGDGAQALVRKLADRMAPNFPDDFPIAKSLDLYAKLARVSAAVAARVYSTPDGVILSIQKRHVRAAAKLMEDVYSLDALGMKKMHAIGIQAEEAQVANVDEVVRQLIEKRAHGLCRQIVSTGEFDPATLHVNTGMYQGDVSILMELFSRGSFVNQEGRRVRAKKALVQAATQALGSLDTSGKTVKSKSARGKPKPPKVK